MHSCDEQGRVDGDRRRFIALGVGALVVAAVPAGRRRRPELVRRSVPVMGTLAEIAVVHSDLVYAHRAIDAAVGELRDVERTMTRFQSFSDVGRANAAPRGSAVEVSRATARVLEEGLRWATWSDGRFDPCYGKAAELWDVTNRQAPPPIESVRRLAGRQLFRSRELDVAGDRAAIRIHDPDAAVDLGGVAKGYGVDRAVAALQGFGIRDGLVNVGGDLYGLGVSPDGMPWRVGIRSASNPAALDGVMNLTDAAVATSGDYLRFFAHGGRRYHHLLDPTTGEPRTGPVRSLTVTASTCMRADAAATTLFGLERTRAERLLREQAADTQIVNVA